MELDEIKVGQKYHWNRWEGFATPKIPDRQLVTEEELPNDIVTVVNTFHSVEGHPFAGIIAAAYYYLFFVAPSTLSPLTEGETT